MNLMRNVIHPALRECIISIRMQADTDVWALRDVRNIFVKQGSRKRGNSLSVKPARRDLEEHAGSRGVLDREFRPDLHMNVWCETEPAGTSEKSHDSRGTFPECRRDWHVMRVIKIDSGLHHGRDQALQRVIWGRIEMRDSI